MPITPLKPAPTNIKDVRELALFCMRAAKERTEPIDITDEELRVLEGLADRLEKGTIGPTQELLDDCVIHTPVIDEVRT